MGSPATFVHSLTEEDVEEIVEPARSYVARKDLLKSDLDEWIMDNI